MTYRDEMSVTSGIRYTVEGQVLKLGPLVGIQREAQDWFDPRETNEWDLHHRRVGQPCERHLKPALLGCRCDSAVDPPYDGVQWGAVEERLVQLAVGYDLLSNHYSHVRVCILLSVGEPCK